MVRLILLRLLETYFRHRWLYLLPIPLLLGVSIASSLLAKPAYTSRGSLWVQGQSLLATMTASIDSSGSWSTPAQGTVDEIGELLQTDSFVRAVVQQTDLEAEMNKGATVRGEVFDKVRKWVWAQTLGTNVVVVSAVHEDASIAQQLATATIEAYMTWRINNDRQESQVAQTFFSSLIEQYEKDVEQAHANQQAYLLEHPDPVKGERPSTEKLEIEKLQAATKDATDRLQKAEENEESSRLSLARAENDVRQKFLMVDRPIVPEQPELSIKRLAINMAIFGIVGVVLGVMGLAGGALLDQSYHFPLDAQYGLSLPVLATLPVGAPLPMETPQQRGPVGATSRAADERRATPQGDSGIAK